MTHAALGSSRSYRHRVAALSSRELALASDAYRQLCAWRLEHTPWLLQPGGAAIFFRLMRAPEGRPLTISELYRGAGASAPKKVLATLEELHRKGLVTISADPKDGRHRRAEATDLLRRLARCYVQTMGQLL